MFIFGLKYFLGMFSSLSLSFLSIAIVNIALFILKFFNLLQGDILTRAEKHFETLKDTSLPLHIWYQDGLTNPWKSKKLILQGKGYASISPDGSNELIWLPLQKIQPKGDPNIQTKDKTTKTLGSRNSNTSMAALQISKKRCTWRHRLYDLPTWGQIKPLLIKLKIWFLNRECLGILKIFFFAMLALLAFASTTQADLIDHT